MTPMKANITVTLKPGVLDTQGEAVKHALESMDGAGVSNVRIGKFIEIEIGETAEDAAMEKLKSMCDRLLANPVMENYHIELVKE